MISVGVADISKVQNIDVIVNAANGIGVLGRGVAGALSRAGGEILSQAARAHCVEFGPYEAGTFYCTDAGLLKRRGVKMIYHAVTMKFPGGLTSLDSVLSALRGVLTESKKNGVKSIAIPGLGTGIGRLDRVQVAQQMAEVIEPFAKDMDIYVIDMNQEFIDAFRESLKTKSEDYGTASIPTDTNPQ